MVRLWQDKSIFVTMSNGSQRLSDRSGKVTTHNALVPYLEYLQGYLQFFTCLNGLSDKQAREYIFTSLLKGNASSLSHLRCRASFSGVECAVCCYRDGSVELLSQGLWGTPNVSAPPISPAFAVALVCSVPCRIGY